ATLAVVIGVLAPAIAADRAAVIDVMTQLADVLDHHVHAVRIALAQMPAAGIVRPLPAEANGAVADVLAAVALAAQAIILQLQHGGKGEGVIGARHVDFVGAYAGVWP